MGSKIDEGYTEFGSSTAPGWLKPTGLLGRFFAKFFASKAGPTVARDEPNPTVIPSNLGDAVVNPDVITGPNIGYQSNALPMTTKNELSKKERYKVFEDMDNYPEIGAAFDIYADECSQKGTNGERWTIEAKSTVVQEEIYTLFSNIRLEDFYWDIFRNTVKYGDCYTELIVDLNNAKKGIQKLKILNPGFLIRVENEFGYLENFFQEIPSKEDWSSYGAYGSTLSDKKYIPLDKEQLVHFRLHTSDPAYYPYGKSIAAMARGVFRSLQLMEDAMLIYRLERAPERWIFYINVGSMPPAKVSTYIEDLKQKFKKEKFYDRNTSQIDAKYNPLCLTKDTKIPLLDGRTLSIEELISSTKENEKIWLWASDGNKLVPATACRPFISGRNARIIKVTLDNGKTIKCTPEHKFLLRDGTYKEAQYLTEEDSIFPFYSRMDKKGYLEVQEVPGEKWKKAYRVIAESIYGNDNCVGKQIHHIDEVKLNNNPDNLIPLLAKDHVKLHFGDTIHSYKSKRKSATKKGTVEWRELRAKISRDWWAANGPTERQRESARNHLIAWRNSEEGQKILKENLAKLNKEKLRFGENGPNWRGGKIDVVCKFCDSIFQAFKSQNKKYCSMACVGHSKVKHGKYSTKYFNHKITSIEDAGIEDTVYDLTVDVYHNFAIDAGIVVHNSQSENFYVPVRNGNDGTKIETLEGAANLGEVDDVKYFRDKLLALLKIPKDFIVEKDKSPERKANLSQLDVKFARTIARVQQCVELGLESIAKRHLQIKGFPESTYQDLRVKLPEPSDMAIKRKLDVEEQKARVIAAVQATNLFSKPYIYKSFYGMTGEQIESLELEIQKDLSMESQGVMPATFQAGGMMGMEGEAPVDGEAASEDTRYESGADSRENDAPTNVKESISAIMANKRLSPNAKKIIIDGLNISLLKEIQQKSSKDDDI